MILSYTPDPEDDETQPATPVIDLSDGERLFLAWFSELPQGEAHQVRLALQTASDGELIAVIERIRNGAQQGR